MRKGFWILVWTVIWMWNFLISGYILNYTYINQEWFMFILFIPIVLFMFTVAVGHILYVIGVIDG